MRSIAATLPQAAEAITRVVAGVYGEAGPPVDRNGFPSSHRDVPQEDSSGCQRGFESKIVRFLLAAPFGAYRGQLRLTSRLLGGRGIRKVRNSMVQEYSRPAQAHERTPGFACRLAALRTARYVLRKARYIAPPLVATLLIHWGEASEPGDCSYQRAAAYRRW
jgi:hypothetical protein